MKRWVRMLFALPVVCGAAAGTAPLSRDELNALAAREICVAADSGGLVYAGESAQLGACLGRLGKQDGAIAELRITSGGGDAWGTLEVARALRGRLDLLIVDGICASACANYLLPAAKRLLVEPRAYVLLHGSMNQDDATGQHDEIRRQIREGARTQAWAQGMSEAEIEQMAQQSIDSLHADLEAHIPVQAAFARETLACDDWLDPRAHFSDRRTPEGMAWLLVTPEMAARCFTTTRIETFWAPETQDAFDSKLGFFRALK